MKTIQAVVMGTLMLVGGDAAAADAKPAAGKTDKTELTWWGHAAFVLKTPAGTTVAIDPWLKNPKAPKDAKWPEKLDVILVTHAHFDHVGDTVELAKKTGATLISSFELCAQLGVEKSNCGNMGGTIKIKDVTIHMTEAVHSGGLMAEDKSLKYGGPAMGFVIEVANGPTLYHAGDTTFFSSMALIAEHYKPTYALLPIGGHYTMDPAGAAFAAKLLKVKTVIPMHFGTFGPSPLSGTPEELSKGLAKEGATATVLEFKPGETKAL